MNFLLDEFIAVLDGVELNGDVFRNSFTWELHLRGEGKPLKIQGFKEEILH